MILHMDTTQQYMPAEVIFKGEVHSYLEIMKDQKLVQQVCREGITLWIYSRLSY